MTHMSFLQEDILGFIHEHKRKQEHKVNEQSSSLVRNEYKVIFSESVSVK